MKKALFVYLSFFSSLLNYSVFAGSSYTSLVKDKTATVLKTCGPDIKKFCSGVPKKSVMACLKSQDTKNLTSACASKMGSSASSSSAESAPAPKNDPVSAIKNKIKLPGL